MAILKLALADYSDLGQRQEIDEDKGIQGPKEPSGRRGQAPGATQQTQRFPTLFSRKRQVTRNRVQPPSPLPPLQGSLGRDPLPPSTGHTPSPGKLPSRTSLGGNLTSASKSGSEVTVLAQDDRMEHFWLTGISLRGQAAELETRAG
jgi:hypothetical protein